MQSGSVLATYVALMGAYLAGFSPLEFALYLAVLLSLCLTLFYLATTQPPISHAKQSLDSVVPSLSDSMAELHSLQSEINNLQTQFVTQTGTLSMMAGKPANFRSNDNE